MNNNQLSIDSFLKNLQMKHSLTEALELTTADEDQITAFAIKFFKDGKLESSLKLLQGLTSLCPEKSQYWTALGAVLTRLERYEQSIPVLTAALQIDCNDTAALVNRGECYIALAENEKAAADLQRAIDLDPKQLDQASNRARQIVFGMATFFQECIEEGLDEVEISDEK
jgi:tetratricopeptide (TPR) repeat protein